MSVAHLAIMTEQHIRKREKRKEQSAVWYDCFFELIVYLEFISVRIKEMEIAVSVVFLYLIHFYILIC